MRRQRLFNNEAYGVCKGPYVQYDVIIWGSPTGSMHCAFCTRQNIVVPNFVGVSQELAVSQTGHMTRRTSD